MKKRVTQSALFLSMIAIIGGGCDLTDDEIDGQSGSQGGDPVVVDLPIAYIQRPVPIGMLDDDDDVSILPENALEPSESRAGAVLVMKDRAAVSAPSTVITEGMFAPEINGDGELIEPLYDVRDLSANTEGTKLVFSVRAPLNDNLDDDDPDQPTWNIWEYELENGTLTRIIDSNIEAEKGHDRFPVYLPDDSIVFSSTRQKSSKELLLNLNGSGYTYVTEAEEESRAFTLHRIDDDHEDIVQISYGKGHDIHPTVLDDGRILFLRGDDTSNRNGDRLSLYTIHPDGTNLNLHYGFHSVSGSNTANQGALLKPQEMPNGEILVSYKPRETDIFGGDIVSIDTENYIDNTQPTSANLGGTGPAERSISVGEVVLEAQSPHGYFYSAYPMYDDTDRLLVSWMPCLVQGYRLNIYVEEVDVTNDDDEVIDSFYQLINSAGQPVDEDGDVLPEGADPVVIPFEDVNSLPCSSDTFENDEIEPSEPQFGIWVYDPVSETQDPVVLANQIGIMYTEAIVIEPKSSPTFIPNAGSNDDFTSQLVEDQLGIINIRSIYDIDGSAPFNIQEMADPVANPTDTRQIRFVRFIAQANMPHEDELEIDEDLIAGRNNNQPSRSIIGYAQVHPDGSVMTKVPANTAFAMEFVDANGRRITGNLNRPHRNWLNVRPGETRSCNGCHSATSTAPHGREDAEPEPANAGALAEVHFPNTSLRDRFDTPYAPPLIGETMAEYYVRTKLQDEEEPDPLALSLDLIFEDEWTDPNIPGINVGDPIDIRFGNPESLLPENLQTLAPVVLASCLTEWEYRCRTTIDYPEHIQPIFEVARSYINGDGDTVVITCTNCHSAINPNDVTMEQIPAPNDASGLQLDFRNMVSPLDNDGVFLLGYDELFATGGIIRVDDGAGGFANRQVPDRDDDGNIIYRTEPILDLGGNPTVQYLNLAGDLVCLASGAELLDPDLTPALNPDTGVQEACIRFTCTTNEDGEQQFSDENDNQNFDLGETCDERVPVLVDDQQGRYLSANGANAAQNQPFFDNFEVDKADDDNNLDGIPDDHFNYLTPAELKLLSEWLDMGGQYYNDIFKAVED